MHRLQTGATFFQQSARRCFHGQDTDSVVRAEAPLMTELVATAGRRHYTIDVIELTVEDGAVLLPVKAVPGASRTRLMGELNGRLKVAVSAPPEKGKANKAIVALIADALGVPRRDVEVVAGLTNPFKTIRIDGAEVDAVRAALQSSRS